MARSISGGRSYTASRPSGNARRTATTRRRHHKSTVLAEEAAPPDVDELRRLRQAYFGGGPSTRRKESSIASRTRLATNATTTRSGPKSGSKATKGPRPDRTSEYVYATAAVTNDDELRRRHVRRRSRGSNQDADGLSTIPESEVTPDDSVSQIGSRRRRSKKMKPSLRPVAEKVDPSAAGMSQSNRESIFGSIFSRRSSTTTTAPVLVDCLTCGANDIPTSKSVKLDCGHRMCHSCLKRVFKLAVHDPAHMPPRCCTDKAIPLRHVDKLFDLRFKLVFNKKLDEFKTKDRIYCPNKRCGIWIRPEFYRKSGDRRYAQCRRCKTRACLQCGLKLHKAQDCPKDPEIAKLNEQAERQGWKRCYRCNAMVELKEGCNHMTCRCTAEFCMVCGAKWKTCDCPWFSLGAVPVLDEAGGQFDPIAFVQRHLFGQPAEVQPVLRTYREEMEHRRQQEQVDADLARRMQLVDIWN